MPPADLETRPDDAPERADTVVSVWGFQAPAAPAYEFTPFPGWQVRYRVRVPFGWMPEFDGLYGVILANLYGDRLPAIGVVAEALAGYGGFRVLGADRA